MKNEEWKGGNDEVRGKENRKCASSPCRDSIVEKKEK
jgi:hypothetical protein